VEFTRLAITYMVVSLQDLLLQGLLLPLDPAKVKDLRTLSVYLKSYMSQDTIDDLYPCPEGESGDSSNDEADGEDDDAHDE
jgi:hypothetical protein